MLGLVWFVSNLLFSTASPAPVFEFSAFSVALVFSIIINFLLSFSDSSMVSDCVGLLLVLRGIPGDAVLLASLLGVVR